MESPNIPKGTRDFSSIEMRKRNYLIQTIREKFELFGFFPIETPSFEKISTLIGKYGKEGDYLMFKLLHSGHVLKKRISDVFRRINNKEKTVDVTKFLTEHISNKALRYDLTVPFVRYVGMHKNEIVFPFKRYQIQPVWRADKPQKGRFREFYQCDADIISYSWSLWKEIELIQLCDEIFTKLNFPIIIYINHRDILGGLVEISGIKNNLWKDFTTSLDKWDKIGRDLVKKEMLGKGISSQSFEKIAFFFDMKENFYKKEKYLTVAFQYSKKGKKGIKDLSFIYQNIKSISLQNTKLEWNISLARGMNYYTGTILEIVPFHNNSSSNSISIGGGGRYDQLANLFGMKNISGVGISLGLDRIYLAMEKENLLQTISNYPSKVLFINFGDEEVLYAYKMIKFLRKKGISTQLYPHAVQIGKQFRYANENNIPFTISIGKNEIQRNKIRVKNLKERTEKEYDHINDVVDQLKSL
ncbi:histidine-tRNA ligase [Blattabacterium sp. (Blattella germanica) str. Bge]|uniref:histidine--tRNA ligase n=1 Tax=Blattabacterium sp. (Blattella germanica) TaxID=624186 RepID=UPI0001BB61BC|nr:histidine--tRNA ligase [Blattabacterium sp. (Blattella germanica)]ACY40390.1 histidine-tRNA ligase [Blattabacterium sp. (Blattella germanica) str. Bge]